MWRLPPPQVRWVIPTAAVFTLQQAAPQPALVRYYTPAPSLDNFKARYAAVVMFALQATHTVLTHGVVTSNPLILGSLSTTASAFVHTVATIHPHILVSLRTQAEPVVLAV